jgi:hypothetical protein
LLFFFFRFCFFSKNWCYFSDSQSASRVFARSAEKRFFLLIEKEAGLESICCKHNAAKAANEWLGLKSICCKHRRLFWKKIRYSKKKRTKNIQWKTWIMSWKSAWVPIVEWFS